MQTNVDRTKPIIEVKNVSKQYLEARYQFTIRNELIQMVGHAMRRKVKNPPDPFTAVKDVSFTVQPGEAVAVIGRNGSGKTTLFRILCGITSPTTGEVIVRGQFMPMISLGAGFNSQLTGRQNIYLNTAIRGLDRNWVESRIPEILKFSEIGKFIDRPVKLYSSGMRARLGFSIAINTMPDILFVDETLAVGDEAFKEKCSERIKNYPQEGRTFMLITHSLSMAQELCSRGIWMHKGSQRMDAPIEETIGAYKEFVNKAKERSKS